MNRYTINSSYKQFYIADSIILPKAPEEWTDNHVKQRHNTQKNIVALCPEGDITARIICLPPNEIYHLVKKPDFEIITHIDIESGKIGIFEWPWELLEEHSVIPGNYTIRFMGFDLVLVDAEKDYYIIETKIKK